MLHCFQQRCISTWLVFPFKNIQNILLALPFNCPKSYCHRRRRLISSILNTKGTPSIATCWKWRGMIGYILYVSNLRFSKKIPPVSSELVIFFAPFFTWVTPLCKYLDLFTVSHLPSSFISKHKHTSITTNPSLHNHQKWVRKRHTSMCKFPFPPRLFLSPHYFPSFFFPPFGTCSDLLLRAVSLSATSTLASPLRPVISSTNVVVSTSEPSRRYLSLDHRSFF